MLLDWSLDSRMGPEEAVRDSGMGPIQAILDSRMGPVEAVLFSWMGPVETSWTSEWLQDLQTAAFGPYSWSLPGCPASCSLEHSG